MHSNAKLFLMLCTLVLLLVNSSVALSGQEPDPSTQSIGMHAWESSDNAPAAVPVLSPEEAELANKEAISLNLSRLNKQVPAPKKKIAMGLPEAVPLLSPEEARKANREAKYYYTTETVQRSINDFLHNNDPVKNRVSIFVCLIPILLCFSFFPKRRKNKERKYYFSLQRRFYILSSVAFFAFGLIAFVPWSVYFGNSLQFPFIFQDFMANSLFALALSICLCSAVLLFIPPIISDYVVSAIAGLGLCIYLQSMFMNVFLGSMNGTDQNWDQHRLWGWINIFIWVAIVLAFICIKAFFKSRATQIISAVTTFFLFLEATACISMVLSAPEQVWERKGKYICDGSKQFEFSRNKNIMLFCFDALGSGLVNPSFEADPEIKEILKDFTWYTDARYVYNATFPALIHEITGAFINPGKNQRDVLEKAWLSPTVDSFFSQVHKAGYDTRIFIRNIEDIGPEESYRTFFSNVMEKEILYRVDFDKLYSGLIQISGFSSVPYLLKKRFLYADDSFRDIVEQYVVQDKDNINIKIKLPSRNETYYQQMLSTGITASDIPPVLSYHYTRGAHAPWAVDEKCQPMDSPTDDIIPSARSCFFLLSNIVNLLKEKNVYDQTAIIIFSDHGSRSKYSHKCDMTVMIKPFHANNKEMILDNSRVSSIDIAPTVLQIACGPDADLSSFEGYPVGSIPPDRKRRVLMDMINPDIPVFYGVDGITPLPKINCLREHVFEDEESFDLKKSFIRFIPWTKDAVVDEKILKTYQ